MLQTRRLHRLDWSIGLSWQRRSFTCGLDRLFQALHQLLHDNLPPANITHSRSATQVAVIANSLGLPASSVVANIALPSIRVALGSRTLPERVVDAMWELLAHRYVTLIVSNDSPPIPEKRLWIKDFKGNQLQWRAIRQVIVKFEPCVRELCLMAL